MALEFSVLQSKQYWCFRANIDYRGFMHVGRKLAKKKDSLIQQGIAPSNILYTSVTFDTKKGPKPLAVFSELCDCKLFNG